MWSERERCSVRSGGAEVGHQRRWSDPRPTVDSLLGNRGRGWSSDRSSNMELERRLVRVTALAGQN